VGQRLPKFGGPVADRAMVTKEFWETERYVWGRIWRGHTVVLLAFGSEILPRVPKTVAETDQRPIED
jgi:hypothetical protein